MRSLAPLLALVLLVGCADAIGLGSSCTAAKRSVQRLEGTPDRTAESARAGDFEEQWIYFATGGSPGRVYTFRWGLSYESCEVSGPDPLLQARGSGAEPILILLAGDRDDASPNRR